MRIPTDEFLNSTREWHATGAGGSVGALTAFVWLQYSQTAAFVIGAVFLSVVTGIRFTALLRASDDARKTVDYWISTPTDLITQLRQEGHYTVTAFTIAAAAVYVALIVF